jgi:chemotaxis protein CheD
VASSDRIIQTVLGSCVSVCLKDPTSGIAGMNHYMLSDSKSDKKISRSDAGRYGIYAMKLMLNEMIRKGADKTKMTAKVFGGGHVLKILGGKNPIPDDNVRYAISALDVAGIPVKAMDVGGTCGRKIQFFIREDRVKVDRFESSAIKEEKTKNMSLQQRLVQLEQKMQRLN